MGFHCHGFHIEGSTGFLGPLCSKLPLSESLRDAHCLIIVSVRVIGPKIASLSYCCHVCSCHMMLWNSLSVLIVLSNCTGNICGCEGMLSVKAPKLMLSIKAA